MIKNFSQEKWIKPKNKKTIMLDKYVSTSSRLAKMMSVQSSNNSVFHSASRNNFVDEIQNSINIPTEKMEFATDI